MKIYILCKLLYNPISYDIIATFKNWVGGGVSGCWVGILLRNWFVKPATRPTPYLPPKGQARPTPLHPYMYLLYICIVVIELVIQINTTQVTPKSSNKVT